MKLHISGNEEKTIAAFTEYFVAEAQTAIEKNGHFNVALSGGSSPKRVYELLASPPYRDMVRWSEVFFFFGDERYVPFADLRSNALMAQKALFGPLDIATDHVFRVDTTLPLDEAAVQYWKDMQKHFGEKPVQFDLVMLGLGDDAHTASLFLHTDILHEKSPGVRAVFLEKENVYRISMTAPLINQAAQIAFLVFGENKAEAVEQVLIKPKNIEKFPAQLISAHHWFLDEKAAGLVM